MSNYNGQEADKLAVTTPEFTEEVRKRASRALAGNPDSTIVRDLVFLAFQQPPSFQAEYYIKQLRSQGAVLPLPGLSYDSIVAEVWECESQGFMALGQTLLDQNGIIVELGGDGR